MKQPKTIFRSRIWHLIVVLVLYYSPIVSAYQVSFEGLNIGDPPSAIPGVYPGLTGVVGPPGTSIESGVPYANLSNNVLQTLNGGAGEYIGFLFAQPHQRFIIDVSHFPIEPYVPDGNITLLFITCFEGGAANNQTVYALSLFSSGFYETELDFNSTGGLNGPTQCDEIRISTFSYLENNIRLKRPLGLLAVDCLRVDEDVDDCKVLLLVDVIRKYYELGLVLPGDFQNLLRIYNNIQLRMDRGNIRPAINTTRRLIRYTNRHRDMGITHDAADQIVAAARDMIEQLSQGLPRHGRGRRLQRLERH